MNVTFQVNQVGFETIENYQDEAIEFKERKAKKEIKKLLKSYKLILACSKAFYGQEEGEKFLKMKSTFEPYKRYSPFEKYIVANIREDFAEKDYENLDLEHFYSFCEELAQRPYILDLKDSKVHKICLETMIYEDHSKYENNFEQSIDDKVRDLLMMEKSFENLHVF